MSPADPERPKQPRAKTIRPSHFEHFPKNGIGDAQELRV
jgi:hypothetical protein